MPCVPPGRAMYTERSVSSALDYNAFAILYTERCALSQTETTRSSTAQQAGRTDAEQAL
jgi:hypothetical protein